MPRGSSSATSIGSGRRGSSSSTHVDVDDPLVYDVVINTDRASVADGVPGVRGVIDELLVVRIPRGYGAM